MKLRYVFAVALVTALAGWFTGTSVAEDKPSEADMMAKMKADGMPSAMHKHMEFMVGDWTTEMTMWMQAGESKSKGTSTVKWALGGRYLDISYAGPFMGGEFKGRGYMGHNNPKKQFEMIWVDNFSSGMDFKTGSCSEDGKVITLSGFWDGPMGKLPTRMVYKAGDGNTWTMTSFTKMGDQEHKDMEIVYTRKAK